MKRGGRHSLFDLNQAALDGDMSLGQRIAWLWLMVLLGGAALVALWACR